MTVGKIKEFNLVTGNWTLYCERVDLYFEANGVEDKLKLPSLISLVGEEVYELMVTLASPKKPPELRYEDLVDLARGHLQPQPSVWAERYRFRQEKQSLHGNVMQFVAALKKVSKECDFGINLNDHLRDQFVCGVKSELIRQRLFSEPVTMSFSEAVTLATSLEAAERDATAVVVPTAPATTVCQALDATSLSSKKPYISGRSSRDPGESTDVKISRDSCTACGGRHQVQECRYSNFVCALCKNRGHLRKVCVCPFKNSEMQEYRGQRRQMNCRRGQTHYSSEEKASECAGIQV